MSSGLHNKKHLQLTRVAGFRETRNILSQFLEFYCNFFQKIVLYCQGKKGEIKDEKLYKRVKS